MNIEACYYLGYTSKIHGKEGSLVVKLDVDNPTFYKKLESVFIQLNKLDNELVPFFITSTQLSNNDSLILKIEDINDVEQAKAMVGKEVFLPLDMLPPLKGNKHLEDFFRRIFHPNPSKRLTITQMKQHPLLLGYFSA